MAIYRISGVWKNTDGVITHYAFHTVVDTTATRAAKKTKSDAIRLLETTGNVATTWIWGYNRSGWIIGENVEVVNGSDGKYLRSDRNNTITDNLAHLIDFDWIAQ
jgi:hypothetical protein